MRNSIFSFNYIIYLVLDNLGGFFFFFIVSLNFLTYTYVSYKRQVLKKNIFNYKKNWIVKNY